MDDNSHLKYDDNEFSRVIEEMQHATQEITSGIKDASVKQETIEESNEEIEENLPQPPESSYSEVEKEAMSKGWKSEDKFSGSPDDFRSAKEFVALNDFYEERGKNRRYIKELQQDMKVLTDLNKRQYEMLNKERADYILQQKREAIQNGDIEGAEKFEKAYYEYNKPLTEEETTPPQKAIHPAALEFKEKHSNWFFNENSTENKEMTKFVLKKEKDLDDLYPNLSPVHKIEMCEKAVKEAFPHRFGNKNRLKPSPVNMTASENATIKKVSSKSTFNQLPSKWKTVVRSMARHSQLGLDEYAQQLLETGVINNE